MIIYENNAIGFRDAVDNNHIVLDIEKQYKSKLGRSVAEGERRAWNNSLKFMETIIRKSKIPNDCGVLIEYNIPTTSKRIDFVITGHDERNNKNFVIIELKQWDKAEATDKEDLVIAYVNKRNREMPHPSYQALSYKRYMNDMNEAVHLEDLHLHSCAYLHNYQEKKTDPLKLPQYNEIISESPIFFAQDNEKLQNFIKKYVGKGSGMDILYLIEKGKIRPSKKFVEYVSNIFNGNEVYTLIDEQKIAYENIVSAALTAKGKRTIIINGGPGTGKSVVSMNAFVTLLQKEKNIKFVAPNTSFRTALINSLANNTKHSKKRLSALFSGSGQFWNSQKNEFDVLVVDEAHRLKGKGAYMYKGENQIVDIINASEVNVFFIDDFQRIRPDDIGTVNEIKRVAKELNSEVVEIRLEAQFRCAGAEGFLNWVDHNFQIKDTANFDGWDRETFEFEILDNPHDVFEKIKAKNEEGYKARMLAGFAWKWSKENEGNYNGEIDDVEISEYDFKMPWNGRKIQTTWAIDQEGVHQIGCVHTSQGLEFDYVGVIIGNDLKYDPNTEKIYASYNDYQDSMGKRGLKNNPMELTMLIKNIYKVLLSRGMRGCYVFCRDKNLQEYLKERLIEIIF